MAAPASLTPDQLKAVIAQTLSPDTNIRVAAEQQLNQDLKSPNHTRSVLQVFASADGVDPVVQQAAAIRFKNLVKKGWDVNREDTSDGIQIPPEHRTEIKTHLVNLMCTVSPQIRVQCSEAISLIAAVDFPQNWDNLLADLVGRFNDPNPAVVDGVLITMNSIFKRSRYVLRSEELYRVLIYSLERVQEPILALFQTTGQAVAGLANNPEQLTIRFSILHSIARIYYSLVYQDLPEYFEDHIKEWMTGFAVFLQYKNPLLVDDDEDDEPSPVDKLQTAIIENLKHHADLDEEVFIANYIQVGHDPNFIDLVWKLLIALSSKPKHDALAAISIRFLSSLMQKLMHKDLFKNQDGPEQGIVEQITLEKIITSIVIPNLAIREVDEERFEDDPAEFISLDIEGAVSDSRRWCSQDLLRSMCRHHKAETTAICSQHVGAMLNAYAADPVNQWKSKDVAIQIMMCIAIEAESSNRGVSSVNEQVNVGEFFSAHILPELQDSNHAARPMVKAMCLKFVSTFRNQFTTAQLTALMPFLISHLGSPSIVVHTFAAYTVERILITKNQDGTDKFGATDLQPFLTPLFTALFGIIDNVKLNENAYAMKCVMRSLSVSKQNVVPITQTVLERLTAALERVAKNPRNPQFNHYMFESIAVLIRTVCSADPNMTASFEALLFTHLFTVLKMDVAELTPYVFQLLAQILEYRPAGLGDAYTELFTPLLSPDMWDHKGGNVPPMVRLLSAYLQKSATDLVEYLEPVLGIFQKLNASKANEISAYALLTSATEYYPYENLQPQMSEVFKLIAARLLQQNQKRYLRLATQYFAFFVGKFGPNEFFDKFNALQDKLALNVLVHKWLPRFTEDLPSRLDAKVQVVGLTKLLCDAPERLLAEENGQQVWAETLKIVVTLLASPTTAVETDRDNDDILGVDVDDIGYDATFSSLQFAKKRAHDPFADIADPTLFFVQRISGILSSPHANQVRLILQSGAQSDPKLLASLEKMFSKAGLTL